jgi:hypothetical protein
MALSKLDYTNNYPQLPANGTVTKILVSRRRSPFTAFTTHASARYQPFHTG